MIRYGTLATAEEASIRRSQEMFRRSHKSLPQIEKEHILDGQFTIVTAIEAMAMGDGGRGTMRLGEVLLAVALPAQILTQGRELPQRALGDFVTSISF